MEKEERYILKKENRLRVLPANPYFKKEVEETRQQVGGFARASRLVGTIRAWEVLTTQPSVKEDILRDNINPAQWVCPVNYVVTHAHALRLMERFNLPYTFSVFLNVLYYMVEGRFATQTSERPNTLILDDSAGSDDLMPSILTWRRGIAFEVDEYTTKKEFHSLWPTVVAIRDGLRDSTDIEPPQRRRKGEKWERQQNRWLGWYRLHEKLGSPEKVADYLSVEFRKIGTPEEIPKALSELLIYHTKTERNERYEVPGVETIRNAIKQLEELWRPAS